MKRFIFIFVAMVMATLCVNGESQERVEIALWPSGAPTPNGLESKEEAVVNNLITNVSESILYVYPASQPNGKMVIACPGGAYACLAMDHEGHDMADWFTSRGITYGVLKYRMPNGHSEVPLEDARQAISIAREKASEWGVDPDKIGIMGASAGGHLAASLATLYGDAAFRPAFQILLYPVITMGEHTHRGSLHNLLGDNPSPEALEHFSLDRQVDPQTPRAFIVLSADDQGVSPVNGIGYAQALIANKVPVSLHVYPTGEHGWGFRDSFPYKPEWTAELQKFLSEI